MNKKQALLLFCFVAALSSCSVEPMIDPAQKEDNRIPLNIEGSIDQIPTRATAAGFVDQDAVGLFAVNYQEGNTVAGILQVEGNQADNVKYVFSESDNKWIPIKPVYYKDVNTNVDLYLYYPYEATIQDVNAAHFEVKKDQSAPAGVTELSGYEASDWMWGKAENITPTESRIRVTLRHRLAAVQVTLKEGSGFAPGEFSSLSKSVIVTNTTRKATLDYATGSATPLGEPQLDGIVMSPQSDGTFRAVVIPQTVAASRQLFAITVDGVSYDFTQNNPVTYQQGKQLGVSININKKSPAGNFELELADFQIVPWTEDLNTHGGEARQYFVVNVTTPGKLGDVIASMGKNPAKIRNLKVTGTVNADDFYFMRDQMEILEAVNMKECQPPIINRDVSAYSTDDVYECYVACYGEPSFSSGDYHRWSFESSMIPDEAFSGKKSLSKFVFPDGITEIGQNAFANTSLSGSLILPEDLSCINAGAFASSLISSVSFPSSLSAIREMAFNRCYSLSGDLLFPTNVSFIGYSAFERCKGLSGSHLRLPDELAYLGYSAFQDLGDLYGDLIIPEKIKKLRNDTFYGTRFTGTLILNNVQELAFSCFYGSGFSGGLSIPEGVTDIPMRCFYNCQFSSLSFPSTLKTVGETAFYHDTHLVDPLVFSDGLVLIGEDAFAECSTPSIILPESLQTILAGAFAYNYNVAQIICKAIDPPSVYSTSFNGIAKDNFTIEVPAQSVKRYQAEAGWSDFKRFAAHYDFSLSRKHLQTLNGPLSRSLVLRAPANYTWSIQEKPEWITVEPSSGVGKTEVIISVAEMARTNKTFEVNEGSFYDPQYVNYQGRYGQVVFKLDDKDYTCTLDVEQYDYDYPDGYVQTLQSATRGQGINIVFTGDGYDARDIAKGTFINDVEAGLGHFFDVEPYKTYKDYFNVYAVTALSDESGIETINTVVETKFSSILSQNRIVLPSPDEVFAWAMKADAGMDLTKSLVILLQNTSTYEGITYMYGDGSAIACCPVSTQAYPYDFRGIVQHEAGGHGFGKLADEYIYHNAFIQNCLCMDGCDHVEMFNAMKSLGWFKNLSMTSDATQVPWAHLIYHPQYSDYVDMYEGGYMHSRGVYRSEVTSCMNNNIPYFSAISRQAIVERIKFCAGETFSLEDFYANDDDSFGPQTRSARTYIDHTFGVNPRLNHATGHGPVMAGDHPNVK